MLKVAQAEIGVREVGGNDGRRVREYLAYAGIKVPAPYCAAFVSWCFGQAGYAAPRTAWSPSLFPGRERNRVSGIVPGLVFGIYFPKLNRVAHVGFVEAVKGDWLTTIEGNTSPDGGREGVGVFRRLRHKRSICKYSNWF